MNVAVFGRYLFIFGLLATIGSAVLYGIAPTKDDNEMSAVRGRIAMGGASIADRIWLDGRRSELLKNKNSYFWIAIGSSALSLLGLGLIFSSRKTGDYRKCPACAEYVKAEATVCRFCNHTLPTLSELELQQEAEWEKAEKYAALSPEEKAIANETMPKGKCPSCEKIIPIYTLECECGARFGRMSSWKVKPM